MSWETIMHTFIPVAVSAISEELSTHEQTSDVHNPLYVVCVHVHTQSSLSTARHNIHYSIIADIRSLLTPHLWLVSTLSTFVEMVTDN